MESKTREVRREQTDIKLSEAEITFFKNFLSDIDTIWHEMSCNYNSDFELIHKLRASLVAFKGRYLDIKE